MQPANEMTAEYVVKLYKDLESLGCFVWIDGGWGVDALLEEQTRPHSDLDIALEYRFVEAVRTYLVSQGFKDLERDDTSKWNFVMSDMEGHQVDFHSFIFDESGDIIDGLKYPKGSLTGHGNILGQEVKCIGPEHMVKFHTGYSLKEKDRKDVLAICKKFNIELPKEYQNFEK